MSCRIVFIVCMSRVNNTFITFLIKIFPCTSVVAQPPLLSLMDAPLVSGMSDYCHFCIVIKYFINVYPFYLTVNVFINIFYLRCNCILIIKTKQRFLFIFFKGMIYVT